MQPPKYERPPRGSIVDEVEPRIRELLQAYPRMPATVIAERIGWTRSIRVLSARVAELRPVYLPPDPASRTAYAAGEIAQCDFWFPRYRAAGGVGSDPHAGAVAGADHDLCVLALAVGAADPDVGVLRTCSPGGGSSSSSWGRSRGRWCGTVRARSGAGAAGAPS